MKVMLVDTNATFMENLSEKLKGGGAEVFTAGSAREAMDMSVAENIDVVVLNMKEFQRDGINVLSYIKKVQPLTEVIMLTTPSLVHLSIEGMKLGAFDDLLLPPDIGDLQRIINEACIGRKDMAVSSARRENRVHETAQRTSKTEKGEK